jgi:hypothetical protein
MQTGHSQCGTREGGMLNPYSPGGTPCATPPPTTFVEDAYWQPIMAGVGTVEACRRVRITENQFEPPRFSSEALLLEGGCLVRATKARPDRANPASVRQRSWNHRRKPPQAVDRQLARRFEVIGRRSQPCLSGISFDAADK